jgi:UDP-N-acetylmuramyl pentapeptide phosphotransferase/UDP-N-acetylglucosamine-1-phosphate transferase
MPGSTNVPSLIAVNVRLKRITLERVAARGARTSLRNRSGHMRNVAARARWVARIAAKHRVGANYLAKPVLSRYQNHPDINDTFGECSAMIISPLEVLVHGISGYALAGIVISFVFCLALVVTQQWHGHITHDHHHGVQKFHKRPTPRIGGAAIAVAYWALGLVLPGDLRTTWLAIGAAGTPALIAGLLEDITRKVGVQRRLLATMAAGLLFALLTGYVMDKVDLPGVDWLLAFYPVAIFFTCFSIGGVANAINIIDGFHGLAAGSLMIMFAAFAFVAQQVGDDLVFSLAMLFGALVMGFFLVNFPRGHIFLGDGGAYFCGFLLAALGVLLPARNPEVSAWAALLICAYPVIETLASMRRKSRREGHSVGQPDRVHFHMLAHRRYARRLVPKSRMDLRNPATSIVTWALPALTAVFAGLSYQTAWLNAALFFVTVFIYSQLYRVMSLNGTRQKLRLVRLL